MLTRPDRPAGRGQRTAASAVKRLAIDHRLPVLQPPTLRDGAIQQSLAALEPDYLVVAAYGLILPEAVLALPRVEPLNIHASLLPRWRGAAPIARAIEHGDTRTGISIMRMEAGLDTGPVCLRRELAIEADDTAGTLHDRLATLGAEAIVTALDGIEAGTLGFTPQLEAGVSYARKIDKSEAAIDWDLSAVAIAARIRAFDPAPGCTGRLASATDTPLRLFRPWIVPERAGAGPSRSAAEPGRVIAVAGDGVVIACGEQALTIGELQRPGGRRLAASAYLAGHQIAVGDRFIAAGRQAAATS